MKFFKYILILVLFLSCSRMFAKQVTSYVDFCPKPPYETAGTFSRGLQSVSGMNFVARNVAEATLKKEISKFVQGDIKVKAGSFSATDAKKGKFRYFTLHGQNLKAFDIFVSELNLKTICDFIHLDLTSTPVKLLEPMVIEFNAKITKEDLNNIIKTTKYRKHFMQLKFKDKETQLLELSNPRITTEDNKFNFLVNAKLPFIRSFILAAHADLEIIDNRIVFNNLIIGTGSVKINISPLKYFINLINPLEFALGIIEDKGCMLNLKTVKIENGTIILDGVAFLKKS
ncbi:MAG: hypothetical protein PHX18_06165 [Candidatus Gastranaerophilales bacterium]|nr:hypothetical protein [Candidatus Gastranaerophilales bacterium]